MPIPPYGPFPIGQPVTITLNFSVLTDPTDPQSAKIPTDPASFTIKWDCYPTITETTVLSTDPGIKNVAVGKWTWTYTPTVAGEYEGFVTSTGACVSAQDFQFTAYARRLA